MKKIFLAAVLMMLSISVQAANKPTKKEAAEYCKVKANRLLIDGKRETKKACIERLLSL
ncbi:hypothetical protein [Bdellovibrio bacteriovorus]|uniref:hypothetical protein n=1 Tax=Bdellovibrio bacteriovorus TaxID=959 RepID=UPI000A57AEEB|nr:hypothetical protein [Bdellovibrio bacteriovorus]